MLGSTTVSAQCGRQRAFHTTCFFQRAATRSTLKLSIVTRKLEAAVLSAALAFLGSVISVPMLSLSFRRYWRSTV